MRNMAIRASSIVLILLAVVIFSTLAFSRTVSAQTRTTPAIHIKGTSVSCQVLEVHLYSALPAATSCLAKENAPASTKSSNLVTPNTALSSCVNTALWLFWDINEGGAEICFLGSGFANMTNYVSCHLDGNCYNWNDQASSFYTGCSPVNFYVDINTNGAEASAPVYRKGNFPYGAVGNDTLSSIELPSNCS